VCSFAQSSPAKTVGSEVQKIIIDTDIGGDIDDAFAVGLALQSQEFKILGITTAWGDTTLRARLLSRFLRETGHTDIPIAVGIVKHRPGELDLLTQARYAEETPPTQSYPNAVDFILNQIRLQPGEITLVTIGPLTNIAAAIDQDAATFRKLKRVVMMGGSVYRGYDKYEYPTINHEPDREWNIVADISASQKVFISGVPLYVMPLDSTQIEFDEKKRSMLFRDGTPLTDALTLLYHQWSHGRNGQTPILFDVMAVTYALAPEQCPTEPMRVRVDDQGYTKVESGTANAEVCLHSDSDRFFEFFMRRIFEASPQTRRSAND